MNDPSRTNQELLEEISLLKQRIKELELSETERTDRKRVEKTLRKSEERFRRLHETMMDAFAFVDMMGNILEVNQSYINMLGYSIRERPLRPSSLSASWGQAPIYLPAQCWTRLWRAL